MVIHKDFPISKKTVTGLDLWILSTGGNLNSRTGELEGSNISMLVRL
jgi:hypothetical protein